MQDSGLCSLNLTGYLAARGTDHFPIHFFHSCNPGEYLKKYMLQEWRLYLKEVGMEPFDRRKIGSGR